MAAFKQFFWKRRIQYWYCILKANFIYIKVFSRPKCLHNDVKKRIVSYDDTLISQQQYDSCCWPVWSDNTFWFLFYWLVEDHKYPTTLKPNRPGGTEPNLCFIDLILIKVNIFKWRVTQLAENTVFIFKIYILKLDASTMMYRYIFHKKNTILFQ